MKTKVNWIAKGIQWTYKERTKGIPMEYKGVQRKYEGDAMGIQMECEGH